MSDATAVHKYDSGLTSYLMLLLVFCILPVFFSVKDGTGVMFYAGFPMFFTAASSAACLIGSCDFVTDQVRKRFDRRKTANVSVFLTGALKCALLQALLSFLLFYVCSGLAGGLLGDAFGSAVLRFFVPALAAMPFVGVCKGFLHGIGMERQARFSLFLMSGLLLISAPIFGILGSGRGEKVGRLLRNDSMTYVYTACGIGIAVSAAVTLVLLFVGILSFLHIRSLRRGQPYRREEWLRADADENPGEVFRYCAQHIMGSMGPSVVLSLGLLIGFRLWYAAQSSHTNALASMWGGFIGIGFPLCAGLGLVAAMPFTYLAMQVIRASGAGKRRLRRIRLGMLLRLSAYVGIPLSAFVFSAAKEIVSMFPSLTFKAEETAILSLKAGSPLIFLIQTTSLVLVIYWRCSNRRIVVVGGCIAFFVQVVAQVCLMLFGAGITMNVWPSVIMLSTFLIFLYGAGRNSVTAGVDKGWIMDDFLIGVCALIAAVPVIFLNDYFVAVLPGPAAFALAGVIYLILYVLFSILLHAADLRNIHRVPFGEWIRDLAVLMGAANEEN